MKKQYLLPLIAATTAALPASATTRWTLSGTPDINANRTTMTSDDDPAITILDVRLTANGASTLAIYNNSNNEFYTGCPDGSVNLDLSAPICNSDGETVQYTLAWIGSNTFQNNKKLRSVKFPASLTSLGNECFKGCSNLQKADLSPVTGLTYFGTQVFNACTSLTGYFYLPPAITALQNNAFNGTKISGFYGPGITQIDNDAFRNCKALRSIQFGPNMNSFGKEAFRDQGQVIRTVFFEGDPPTTKMYFDRGGNQFMDMLRANAVIFVPMNAAKNAISDGWKAYLEDTEDGWTSPAVQTANKYTLPSYNAETGVWTDGSLYNGNGSVKRTYILRCWDPSDTSATAALLAY